VRPPPNEYWFNEIAAFIGPAYLRNAFAVGTVQEVEFLVDVLALTPGMRVLDAGCGPGRHALELARRGFDVVGVDTSPEFLALARDAAGDLTAEFHERDVRDLRFDGEFDVVICLCQGGFGLLGGGDDELAVVGQFARALRPGGRLALSAFSAYFVVRHLEAGETFDAETSVNHEQSVVLDVDRAERPFDLWTTCYTPRELRLLAERAGFVVDAVFGARPGRYARDRPSIDVPEHLLLAHIPL
jgi:SAM-dependent methyltransferase